MAREPRLGRKKPIYLRCVYFSAYTERRPNAKTLWIIRLKYTESILTNKNTNDMLRMNGNGGCSLWT